MIVKVKNSNIKQKVDIKSYNKVTVIGKFTHI